MSSPPQVDTWTEKTLRSYLETSKPHSPPENNNNNNITSPFNPPPSAVGITGVLPNNNPTSQSTMPLPIIPSNDITNPGFQLLWKMIKLIFFTFLLLSPLLLDYLPLPISLPTWLKRPPSDVTSNTGFPSIYLWLPFLTLAIMGLPFSNIFLRIIIWSLGASSPIGRPKNKQPSLVRARTRHFLSVSQKYVALFAFVIVLSIYLNCMDLETLLPSSTSSKASEDTKNIYLVLNKILFALALGTILFAYKNYAVTSMAMAFNYANYIVRIRDSLFVDRMLMILEDAARASYKMRKRLTANFQNRQDSSRLASIFESPRRALVSAGGWLKTPSALGKDKQETTTPSGSPLPQSPTTLPEPPPVPQMTVIEETFNPLEMQEDLVEFNRLAQRILTTFEGSGLGNLNTSLSAGRTGEGIISSHTHFNSSTGLASNGFTISIPQSSNNEFTTNIANIASSSSVEKTKNDSYHHSEVRRHAMHRAHKTFKWFSKDPISLDDLKICLQGSCSTIDLDRFWSAILLTQRGTATNTDSRSISSSTPAPVKKGTTTSLLQRTLADFIERSYLEVISVANSLSSMEAAVSNLNLCCSIICLVLMLIFLALLFGDFLAALTSVSSLIFGAAFMFGSSAKNIFESIIFLFVVHPFDIGDRVYISLATMTGPPQPISMPGGGALFTNASPGSGPLENFIVLQMHLLTTVFERWDGARIYVPNYVLAMKPIINVRRSGALFDRHYFQIAFDTPNASLMALRSQIGTFVTQERNEYTSKFLFNVELIENVNRVHLVILVQHRCNWQDLEAQLARRTKFLLFMKDVMQELKITYTLPVQKVELFPTPATLMQGSCGNHFHSNNNEVHSNSNALPPGNSSNIVNNIKQKNSNTDLSA